MPKQNKLMQLVRSRLRLTLLDGRILVGQLLAYDKHLNLVLADVEEFRHTKQTTTSGGKKKKSKASMDEDQQQQQQQRRTLGLLMLRGKHVVSMVPEGIPDVNRARIPAAVQMGKATRGAVPAPGAPILGPPPGVFTGAAYGSVPIPPPGMMPPGALHMTLPQQSPPPPPMMPK